MTYTVLRNFHHLAPTYTLPQSEVHSWITAAHTEAERHHRGWTEDSPEVERFSRRIASFLAKLTNHPDAIATRGVDFSDFTHTRWEEMTLCNLAESPNGSLAHERLRHYEEVADRAAEELCLPLLDGPDYWCHVTCTGYSSPSALQKLIARQSRTAQVLHLYHMGCYAALPAIQVADGLIRRHGAKKTSVGILHTELCTLHVHPLLHTAEQLVIESLFADGRIRYEVAHTDRPSGIVLHHVMDQILPHSEEAMTWRTAPWGMDMTLLKSVPELILEALPPFLERLAAGGSRSASSLLSEALFAIHPGGPKILANTQLALQLRDEQVAHSRKILRSRGNISSATLPHIWQAILEDAAIPAGTPIVSLAFGPGLTLIGAIMEKGDA